MKTRVTIYAENDSPLSILGDNPTDKVRMAWEVIINLIALHGEDIVKIETVEVWE